MVNVKYRRKNGGTDCGQIYTGYKKNETKKEKTPAVFSIIRMVLRKNYI